MVFSGTVLFFFYADVENTSLCVQLANAYRSTGVAIKKLTVLIAPTRPIVVSIQFLYTLRLFYALKITVILLLHSWSTISLVNLGSNLNYMHITYRFTSADI